MTFLADHGRFGEPGGEAGTLAAVESGSAYESRADGRDWGGAEVTGIIRRSCRPDLRFLLILTAVAVVSRLVWALWVHPPADYVFSDMAKYVQRAESLAAHGFRSGVRTLAWQTWGTHYLLAVPLALTGSLRVAGVAWGLMGAAAVPAAYLLACRVSTRNWMPRVVGVAVLVWYPNLSNSGFFLSETPFLCFQLWSAYLLVVVMQDGRRAWMAGCVSAVAFAVRPQCGLFFMLVLLSWALNRKRLRHVLPRHLVGVSVPLLAVLVFSFFRFHAHTGYWGGLAENANMNLTAGRCHNIVTQAFKTQKELDRAERKGNTRTGRRVSLPGYRVLAHRVDADNPDSIVGLRPALGEESIRFVGYIGDPEIHREIRSRCYARTGVVEQVRYSLVNVSLLWFVGHQWPEAERRTAYFYPGIQVFRYGYPIVVWIPSLIGMFAGIYWVRRRAALTLCAWQLVTSMTVAAVFFGTIRLRTPYDPFAIILALEGLVLAVPWARAKLARRRGIGALAARARDDGAP